ncbi:Urease accessory protein UreH-like transmembrane domain-containing protein [Cupriavidus sp. H19C3]
MCGGISLAVERHRETPVRIIARADGVQWRRVWWRDTLVMHAGRVSTYTMLGALMGAMGALAWKQDIVPLQRALFGAGSAMLVLSGLWLARGSAPRLPRLERMAARAAQALTGIARAALHAARATHGLGLANGDSLAALRSPGHAMVAPPWLRRYAIGLAWGLVPCGMVYAALALALLAGNAASGALVMIAFGLGTLPNLIVLSGLSGWLRQQARRPPVRMVAGLVIATFGVAGVARAILLPDVLAAHGFCLVL